MTALVTIVLPVYNGANFLTEAVDSLLGQSFTDFELLLSDNASTDKTWSICKKFAKRDQRVKLHRFDRNMGASVNFSHHIPAVESKYVKWAAHDDLLRPTYLESCIDVLEADPAFVLCHTGTRLILADGEEKGIESVLPDLDSDDPSLRFSSMVIFPHLCTSVFGVFRTEVFQQTRLLEPYVGSDRVLLSEVAMRGKIGTVLQDLFLNRRHDLNSIFQYRDETARLAWFDPTRTVAKSYPLNRLAAEYLKGIERSELAPEHQEACMRILRKWMLAGRYLDGKPVVQHLRREQSDWPAAGPEYDCPCGTGLPYGACHGRNVLSLPPVDMPAQGQTGA